MKRVFPVLVLSMVTVAACAAVSASAAEHRARKDGIQELFNGKDLSGWQNRDGGKPSAGWVVEDGAMVRKPKAGDIWTKAQFGDFVLDLEFKTEGNSGIFIRTGNPKDNVQTGIEIQVLPPAANPGKHSCGAVYDALAPTKEAGRKDQWNHAVITAQGSRLAVVLNGEKIIDMDLDRWTEAGKNPDGSKNKYRTALAKFPRRGYIGFQDHGANVWYRNVKIQVKD